MCEDGNVNGEMKTKYESKMETEDRRFKDKEVSEERTDFSFKWLSCPFISN